jgi:Xaa-Pro aminopeptidase
MALFEQVYQVYTTVVGELRINTPFPKYQQRTCDLFEAMGHPTVKTNPITESGYVHSLGHGIGLHVHEKPISGSQASANDVLVPGSVFTIEPGLYYPEKGMGVRLEDSYWARPDGSFEVLGEYPLDLVLKM